MKCTLTYQCDEEPYKQRMVATFVSSGGPVDVKFDFDPPLGDETPDPFGLLERLVKMCQLPGTRGRR